MVVHRTSRMIGSHTMSRIIRCEFVGNWLLFWLLCITGIGIPIALLYLVNGTVCVAQELDEPERFLADFRSGKLTKE